MPDWHSGCDRVEGWGFKCLRTRPISRAVIRHKSCMESTTSGCCCACQAAFDSRSPRASDREPKHLHFSRCYPLAPHARRAACRRAECRSYPASADDRGQGRADLTRQSAAASRARSGGSRCGRSACCSARGRSSPGSPRTAKRGSRQTPCAVRAARCDRGADRARRRADKPQLRRAVEPRQPALQCAGQHRLQSGRTLRCRDVDLGADGPQFHHRGHHQLQQEDHHHLAEAGVDRRRLPCLPGCASYERADHHPLRELPQDCGGRERWAGAAEAVEQPLRDPV